MPGQEPTPELIELEQQLRLLVPREDQISRDLLLFQAGRASARAGWAWPVATGAATLVACALGATLLLRPEPPVVERIVYVPSESAEIVERERGEPVGLAVDEWPAHRRLQEHLLRWGLDGLDDPPRPASPAPTARDLLQNFSELSNGEWIP